jgi:starch phosphorylase
VGRARGEEFDFSVFNAGDYVRAVQAKNGSEVISKVLYPNDHFEAGRELRLRRSTSSSPAPSTTSCAATRRPRDFSSFSDKVAIQLNDTHPAIAIAELMRVLVDEHEGLSWDEAWEHHRRGLRLHQPHPAPRGPRALAGVPLRAPAPAAPQIIFEINRASCAR